MRTWAKGTSRAALLTASFVALGVSAIPSPVAFADTTSGESGVLGGNQANLPVSAPVNACGNALGLLGKAKAGCEGGATVDNNGGGQKTSGKHGVAAGNQLNAPISAPVNACGNAIAILGDAKAGCEGGAHVGPGGKHGHGGKHGKPAGKHGKHGGKGGKEGGTAGQLTDGTSGVLAGNQANAPISAPVNVCGNAAAVLGKAVAGCEGGASVKNGGHTGGWQSTSGTSSVGGGNQANAPISIPIDVCGNAVGNAAAHCEGARPFATAVTGPAARPPTGTTAFSAATRATRRSAPRSRCAGTRRRCWARRARSARAARTCAAARAVASTRPARPVSARATRPTPPPRPPWTCAATSPPCSVSRSRSATTARSGAVSPRSPVRPTERVAPVARVASPMSGARTRSVPRTVSACPNCRGRCR
ncbi:DUF320 domain-containing protein [Actinomadura sp. J1-007]|nr:chaplin family protein [Actinomadura sp. J1-007]MWK35673.1 DUF320 domain-containing protein [Actinomadura sp. J1-007]